MISGGIGITPLQSIFNHLVLQAQTGRSLRKVSIVQRILFKQQLFLKPM